LFSYVNARIKAFANVPEKRRLLENFISLSTLKGINYLLPIITVPYLVRVLGPEKFGLIAFAQAFIQYFILFTDYGFNLSATRKISIFREDKDRISEIFCSIVFIKFAFMVVSIMALLGIVFTIPKFTTEWLVYLFAFGTVFGRVMFPIWFFQGMEKMKYITFLNFLAKAVFAAAIFVFIRKQTDYPYVLLFNSLGFITAGCLSIWLVWKDFRLQFRIPTFRAINEELNDGWHIFISTIAISQYTVSNTLILGVFTNNTIVGYYSAAEKLIKAVQGLLMPVSQTIYPYISKLVSESEEKALKFIRKILVLAGSGALFISLIIFLLAKPIIALVLGNQYQESIIVLKILAFLPFIITLSNIFGIQTMLTFNMEKAFSKILISASCLSIILAVLLAPVYKHIGISFSVLFTEMLVTATMYLYLKYKNIHVISLPA
jgi:PST family polysaccharide transporter